MSHDPNAPGQPPADAAAAAANPVAAAQTDPIVPNFEATPPAPEPRTSPLITEAAELRSELEETRMRLDRALRAYAEAENVRKRLERDKEEAAKYAITKFARDIVAVGDNFQRAVETAPAAAMEEDPALKAFLDGIRLTERELIGALERHGIKRINPTNEMFNPRHHQVVMEMDNAEVPSGTVLQVFQSGYVIEDRVLRPAMVVVAKGGAKAPKPPSADHDPMPPQTANDDRPRPGDAETATGGGFGRRTTPPGGASTGGPADDDKV